MIDTGETVMDAIETGVLKASKRKSHERLFGRVFTALLLALFVVTLLMAIMAGTNIYRSLDTARAQADETRLGSSLIANSVRANDAIDAVATGTGPEGSSLVLVEQLETGTYETRLYLYNGSVVEEYALADAAYTPEKATTIVSSDTFDFAYTNGLLTVFTDQGQTDIALRSVRGGA